MAGPVPRGAARCPHRTAATRPGRADPGGDGQDGARCPPRRRPEREAVTTSPATDPPASTATGDTLVLAFVSSQVEAELVQEWLDRYREARPGVHTELLQLDPAERTPAAMASLVGQLERDEQRSILPVRRSEGRRAGKGGG